METLLAYLKAHDLTQADFAARVGVSQSTVARWCAGVLPSRSHVVRISRLTNGAVTANSFYQGAAE